MIKGVIQVCAAYCITVLAAGFNLRPQYQTHVSIEDLRALRDKTVLILQYNYKEDLLLDGQALDRSLGEKIATEQKASFIGHFKSLWSVKDVSAEIAARYGSQTDFNDARFTTNILTELGGDAGFVIDTAYAYEVPGGGDLKDRLREKIGEKVLPKKAAGIVKDPEFVRAYDFASNTTLLGRDGRTVWNFYGKAQALATFSTLFNPKEFARSFVGLGPSGQSLATKMAQIGDQYNDYLSWLMQQDFNGVTAKSYFSDYPSTRRNKYLMVFPAENKAFVPTVKGFSDFR